MKEQIPDTSDGVQRCTIDEWTADPELKAHLKAFPVEPTVDEEGTSATVDLHPLQTPLGPMLAGTTDDALCLLTFMDGPTPKTHLESLRKEWSCAFHFRISSVAGHLVDELSRYFKGSLEAFTIPLKMAGTDFQQAVWRALETIPYGQTRSYKAQAIHMGNEKAIRAVAGANGANHIAIVIPCHRVIGSDGSLTGYSGGRWRKRALLKLERAHATNPEPDLFNSLPG